MQHTSSCRQLIFAAVGERIAVILQALGTVVICCSFTHRQIMYLPAIARLQSWCLPPGQTINRKEVNLRQLRQIAELVPSPGSNHQSQGGQSATAAQVAADCEKASFQQLMRGRAAQAGHAQQVNPQQPKICVTMC